jgi:hypothetical protein
MGMLGAWLASQIPQRGEWKEKWRIHGLGGSAVSGIIARAMKHTKNGTESLFICFTGMDGSGKSTVAKIPVLHMVNMLSLSLSTSGRRSRSLWGLRIHPISIIRAPSEVVPSSLVTLKKVRNYVLRQTKIILVPPI